MKINIKDINIWQPFFDYEGQFIDTCMEYKITKHSKNSFSIRLRDLMRDATEIANLFQEFSSIEEVEEYLINYHSKLFELCSYESQLKF